MINLLKAVVILVMLSALAGGAAAAYYMLVERPKQRDLAELAAAAPAGQPTPDPSTPDFDKARALRRDGTPGEARAAIEAFLVRYPDTSHHSEAESLLGGINLAELWSGRSGPDRTEYIVQRGDVLDRVAHKMKSDPELIYQTNNLDRIMLRIGQKLGIPQVDFSVQVQLTSRKLTLLNHGKFFKAYPIADARPLPKKSGEIRTKIQEKLAFRDGRRVMFGSKEYVGSLRSLTLAQQPGFTIYAQSDGNAVAGPAKPSGGGLALEPSDVEELHALVSVGTPVTLTAK